MKLEKPILISIIILSIICLLPFLFLCFYIHPVNDDYFYALTHLKLNCINSVIDSYLHWSGRFLATFISCLNPLSLYKAPNIIYQTDAFIVVLLFFLIPLVSFKILLGKYLNNIRIIALTGLFFMTYMSLCPKVSELFYWFSSYVAFTIPNLLTLIFLAILPKKNPPLVILQCILAFIIPGGNEVTAILFVSTMLYTAYLIRSKRIYLLTFLSLISILLVILSPGNAIRMSGQLSSSPYLWTIIISTAQTISWGFLWLPTLIICTLVYIPLIGIHITLSKKIHISIRTYICFVLCSVLLAHIPPTLGLSSVMIGRTANSLYFFFILFYFAGIQILIDRYQKQIISLLQYDSKYKLTAILTFCFVFISPLNLESPVTTAYLDIVSGKARHYDEIRKERDEIAYKEKENKGKIISFKPFSYLPKSIYVNDLEQDSEGQFCNTYCDYHHLKCKVKVAGDTPIAISNFETIFNIGKMIR